MKTISELLGHQSITTTLDVYVHVLPEKHRQAIDVLTQVCDCDGPQEGGLSRQCAVSPQCGGESYQYNAHAPQNGNITTRRLRIWM